MSCVGCERKKVINFATTEGRTYFELRSEGKTHRVYTEAKSNFSGIFVIDELDNLEVLKLSFPDSSKKQNSLIVELRSQRDITSLGRRIIDKDFINSIKGGSTQFENWKAQYLALPETDGQSTKSYVIFASVTDKNPEKIKFVEGATVVFRLKDYFCGCKNGRLYTACFVSTLRCAMDNLCALWDCVEQGIWTDSCQDNYEKAKACLAHAE